MRQTLIPGPEDLEKKLAAKETGIWAPEHLETILSLELEVERKGLMEASRPSDDVLQECRTLSRTGICGEPVSTNLCSSS